MKKTGILFTISLALLLAGCGKYNGDTAVVDNKKDTIEVKEVEIEAVSVYPAPENGFVGDLMPYFDGTKMNIFFLDDQRLGSQGYHPWLVIRQQEARR